MSKKIENEKFQHIEIKPVNEVNSAFLSKQIDSQKSELRKEKNAVSRTRIKQERNIVYREIDQLNKHIEESKKDLKRVRKENFYAEDIIEVLHNTLIKPSEERRSYLYDQAYDLNVLEIDIFGSVDE